MTIETLFFVLIPTYLVLVAYGVVGARRRRLPRQAHVGSIVLMVLIPPAAVLGALYATGDAYLLAGWGVVTLAMFGMGMVTALLAEYIARRSGV